MSVILIVSGIFCIVYYLVIVLYAGITADFAWIWLLGGVILLGTGGAVYYGKNYQGFFPGWIKYIAAAVIIMGVVIFAVLCFGVIRGMTWKGSPDLDYVVVLGAQVKGDVPSRALKKRLVKAYEYAQENPDAILILSGGQGSGENITEAQCMKEYLTEQGLPEERLILEAKSTNTRENLLFSDKLTSCAQKKTGILSNNFHVYRAVKLAEKLGYTQAEGIAAPSDAVMQVHYIVREVFALVKEILTGNISAG